jgi:hypothetical protein
MKLWSTFNKKLKLALNLRGKYHFADNGTDVRIIG